MVSILWKGILVELSINKRRKTSMSEPKLCVQLTTHHRGIIVELSAREGE